MANEFNPEQRTALRSELLQQAAEDKRIEAAAVTGSGATESEDRWSDVDLAFSVSDASLLQDVLRDWTARMYDEHSAVHHTDVWAGAWIYRVFLLASTLQVDLAFVPSTDFRAMAPTFRLVFGEAREPQYAASQSAEDLVGLAWLYALHARSSIGRGKLWQAEYMISGVRDHALALACVRLGLPAVHGRGFDQLPSDVTGRFAEALVRSIDSDELARAFGVVIDGLLAEMEQTDSGLAKRLGDTLRSLLPSFS